MSSGLIRMRAISLNYYLSRLGQLQDMTDIFSHLGNDFIY